MADLNKHPHGLQSGGMSVCNQYLLCQLLLVCLYILPLWCVTCVHDTHGEVYSLRPEGIIFCCWFSLSLYFSYNEWILSFASFTTLPRSFPPPSLLNFKCVLSVSKIIIKRTENQVDRNSDRRKQKPTKNTALLFKIGLVTRVTWEKLSLSLPVWSCWCYCSTEEMFSGVGRLSCLIVVLVWFFSSPF